MKQISRAPWCRLRKEWCSTSQTCHPRLQDRMGHLGTKLRFSNIPWHIWRSCNGNAKRSSFALNPILPKVLAFCGCTSTVRASRSQLNCTSWQTYHTCSRAATWPGPITIRRLLQLLASNSQKLFQTTMILTYEVDNNHPSRQRANPSFFKVICPRCVLLEHDQHTYYASLFSSPLFYFVTILP